MRGPPRDPTYLTDARNLAASDSIRVSDDALLSRAEAWALIGCQPLAQLSNQALLPSLGAMRADLALSYAELGLVVAAFGVARLLVDLPAGSLANRWNPRSVLIAALAASAIGSSLGVLAANGWQLASVRFLIGVGSSVAQAMILAWLVGRVRPGSARAVPLPRRSILFAGRTVRPGGERPAGRSLGLARRVRGVGRREPAHHRTVHAAMGLAIQSAGFGAAELVSFGVSAVVLVLVWLLFVSGYPGALHGD